MAAVLDTLQKVFGFDSFRDNQQDIIEAVMAGRDVFAVMPTGGGKSLCYQLPAIINVGTTVVISPLISLMRDQVDAARENGINAACINSSIGDEEYFEVDRDLKSGRLDLLYVAPERFNRPAFRSLLKSVTVNNITIDEAHCISDWGHDFRPDYLGLGEIKTEFPDVPVSAFTATATARVQDDIIERLNLHEPFTVRASFNRPNLFYQVKSKSKPADQLADFLASRPNHAGIIYRTSRSDVEKTASMLNSLGYKARPYHAGLANDVRDRHQEEFNKDEINVIVATVAFGMGIDKSNVRFVVHADLPKNMEGYYQETGRAGRDGEPAHCLLLFSRGDIAKIKHFTSQLADDQERHIAETKLNQMARFASVNRCRRAQILEYFGEDLGGQNCGACDVCTGEVQKIEMTTDARKLLSAIVRTGQRFGATHIVDVVTGADTKRIRELGHNNLPTYGVGDDKTKTYWRHALDELLSQQAVIQAGDRYPFLQMTEMGVRILKGEEEFFGLQRDEPAGAKGRGIFEMEAGDAFDEDLFDRLRDLRKEIADEQDVPPYVVFSDKTLRQMAAMRPQTDEEMTRVSGVGAVKLERYGQRFLNVICE